MWLIVYCLKKTPNLFLSPNEIILAARATSFKRIKFATSTGWFGLLSVLLKIVWICTITRLTLLLKGIPYSSAYFFRFILSCRWFCYQPAYAWNLIYLPKFIGAWVWKKIIILSCFTKGGLNKSLNAVNSWCSSHLHARKYYLRQRMQKKMNSVIKVGLLPVEKYLKKWTKLSAIIWLPKLILHRKF